MDAYVLPRTGSRGRVIVIGAGAVGLSAATQIRRRGFEVAVLDEGLPGSGASYGNSGLLVADTAMPTSLPGMIWKVPRWLADPLGPLTVRPRYLPTAIPWLWRYLRAGTIEKVHRTSDALRELNKRTFAEWADLVGPAAMHRLVRKDGQVYLWESPAKAPGPTLEDTLRARLGIAAEVLDPGQIRQLYPGISAEVSHGLLIPGNGHTVDPGELIRSLAESYQADGGEIIHEKALKLWPRDGGGWNVMTNLANRDSDKLVVAAGAWSARLLATVGVAIPLETERGYHAMLTNPSVRLGLPILNKTGYFGLSSMSGGLRVSGTVEIAGLEAPPSLPRAEILVRQARRLFPSLSFEKSIYWMGHRPSTPDSLPVIGPVSGHHDLFACFGHGHAGLTGAPASGLLLAQMLAGEPAAFDPAPYAATRFSKKVVRQAIRW